MPPFRQRMAAAASTPSGAPPMPMTACTLVPRTARRDAGREIAVGDQPDARAGAADLLDQLLVARPVEHDDDQVASPGAPRRLAIDLQVLLRRRVEVHGALGRRPDDDLLHVAVGRVQQAALVGGGRARRSRSARRWRRGSCPRADRRRCRPPGSSRRLAADLLADEQHRRLVALALADDDRAAHRAGVSIALRMASTATWSE